ncbi:MAG: hypothetical protein IPN29_14480 [Saprospiraceae bacterium]|nr:hypothetical protein [Saprospiraceae bacterium]
MKIWSFAALLLFISCCDRDKIFDNDYEGKWKLIQVSGGITGGGTDVDWNTLILDEDGDFTFYKDTERLATGNLTVEIKSDCDPAVFHFEGTGTTVNDLRGDAEKCLLIDIEGRLNMQSDCCDRYDYMLEKI